MWKLFWLLTKRFSLPLVLLFADNDLGGDTGRPRVSVLRPLQHHRQNISVHRTFRHKCHLGTIECALSSPLLPRLLLTIIRPRQHLRLLLLPLRSRDLLVRDPVLHQHSPVSQAMSRVPRRGGTHAQAVHKVGLGDCHGGSFPLGYIGDFGLVVAYVADAAQRVFSEMVSSERKSWRGQTCRFRRRDEMMRIDPPWVTTPRKHVHLIPVKLLDPRQGGRKKGADARVLSSQSQRETWGRSVHPLRHQQNHHKMEPSLWWLIVLCSGFGTLFIGWMCEPPSFRLRA
mgnify:CR=1 FL=1